MDVLICIATFIVIFLAARQIGDLVTCTGLQLN